MFDRYVVVDWSANSMPKRGRDSIWIATYDRVDIAVVNLPTRRAAEEHLTDLLAARPGSTTLVGVDFSLGYPSGTGEALGLQGVPWSSMWALLAAEIEDGVGNDNNRFSVAADLNRRMTGRAAPFWGCPSSAVSDHLRPTKPVGDAPVGSWRHVEDVLRQRGRRPFSSWQLLGAGAVGSQSLLGIPLVHRLAGRFGGRLQVWPFTTGLVPADVPGIVVAEVWPSLVPLDDADPAVRDAAQVHSTARWLAHHDLTGRLRRFFSPSMPSAMADAAVAEEGWVLGVEV